MRATRLLTAAAIALASAACSSDEGSNGGGSGAASSSGGSGDGSGGGDATGSGGDLFGGSGSGSGGDSTGGQLTRRIGPEECLAVISRGEGVPLDIYVMFDQSQSMSELVTGGVQRIDAVREAIREFVNSSESNGLGMGIGYFGDRVPTSCDAADYSDPEVAIDVLPDHASAIMGSLDERIPRHETPTGAAIRGACNYVNEWRAAHPGHFVVVLLVTDGIPETPATTVCQPPQSIEDATNAARACAAGPPSVPTYVLGVGPNLVSLEEIAAAGQTGSAYLVGDDNVSNDVLAALNAIRSETAVACDYGIPPAPVGETLDLNLVNVEYMLSTDTERTLVLNVDDEAACDPGEPGWYYDDNDAPQRILLCPTVCSDIESDADAQVDIAIGCTTQKSIR